MARISSPRRLFAPTPLALALLAAFPAWLLAAPDPCVNGECRGNQSAGIDLTAPPGTLTVHQLVSPIQPAAGRAGIRFGSATGADLRLNAGAAGARLGIVTAGAVGIVVASQGTPSEPAADAFLGVPVPGGAGVNGGVVDVHSWSDITTTGASAVGISAQSSTSGYPESMIAKLGTFSAAGKTFKVTSVATPESGTPGTGVGQAVDARIALFTDNADGTKTFAGYQQGDAGLAGRFTVDADGRITGFDTSAGFADLAVGQSRYVAVDVVLDGYRDGQLRRTGETGRLTAKVTRTDAGLTVEKSAWFATFGESDQPQTAGTLAPDLTAYVNGLIEKARGAGGSGNSVAVSHHEGTIRTVGATAHGVLARSNGRAGSTGRNGGGFWSFGAVEPTGGGTGNHGGTATVTIDGRVETHYLTTWVPVETDATLELVAKPRREAEMAKAAVGVFAYSAGGDGGRGGDGGTWYSGRRGGTGGDGGLVEVYGRGEIYTYGHYASGILALSEGGDGGNGGDGGFVTSGSRGGYGGRGGKVVVDGAWTVTTLGHSAHGIWAKSLGGNAGNGGSGGWLVGLAGQGGQATDGDEVTLKSAGLVTTWGQESYGLFAQSVGGFGGSGGSAAAIFYSRGGSGDSAGSGGKVTLTNAVGGEVVTHGVAAHAVFAQSVGGGGGAGGVGEAFVGVGGSGGAGGNAEAVTLVNLGHVQTYGANARGLYAQSVGGGGGDGGDSVGVVGIGGSGAGASKGGTVTLTNSGIVETVGSGANAIFAQSIGGGGGSGGWSAGWFSMGGSGASGGNADAVTVNNSATRVQTEGADATALFAQSAGGGGGKGGSSVAFGALASVAIGGSGALGGQGSTVRVESTAGEILTGGARSHGIFAQSIGGGGGDGGFAIAGAASPGFAMSVALGGKAGGGNDAARVDVVNHSHIETAGADAVGLFAESVGGGGGRGGFAISGTATDGVGVSFGLGGNGGTGGHGKVVWVENHGRIDTGGARSIGLQAQSVGGGGGDGGFSISGGGAGIGTLALSLGGNGDKGGNADGVTVENGGRIETQGVDAYGLLAQSVGGGGGNGGFAVSAAGAGVAAGALTVGGNGKGGGHGSTVDVTSTGAIETHGARAVGLFAQSVGGGGGNGGFVVSALGAGTATGSLGLGGRGDGGGDAAKVTVVSEGTIHTRGGSAFGLLAQSVGGGGGHGGFSIALAGAGTATGALNLGGQGDGGGDGKAVDVTSKGAIDTEGAGAIGLFAQSVGGGGGSGGWLFSGSGAGTGAGTLAIGGSGGGGGDASAVDVTSEGRIVTRGAMAHGLLAQSVGGGGGSGGFSIALTGAGTGAGNINIGGFAAGGGAGSTVTVTSKGDTTTYGTQAIGVFAQSVGGGGGHGGFSVALAGASSGAGNLSIGGAGKAGGDASWVSLTNRGSVTTYGVQSHGVFAQSVGGGGGAGGFSFAGSLALNGPSLNGSLGGFGGEGGDGANVTLENHGAVTTTLADAHALVAQSVGGGGGHGGFSGAVSASTGGKFDLALSVGGFGGAGGDAGTLVKLDNLDGAVLNTSGVASYGMFAQSVGGGGGHGGGSVAIVLGIGQGSTNIAGSYGGSGRAGGSGHEVQLDNTGRITTTGSKAHAIVAQSIGGGGGNGGFSVTGIAARGTKSKDLSLSIGGFGGAAGDGGIVTVTNSGALVAQGQSAAGIVAQSLGGGGGNGGFSFAGSFAGRAAKDLSVSVGGWGGAGGKGQAVSITNTGTVTVGVAASPLAAASDVAAGLASTLAADALDLPPLPEPPKLPDVPDDPEAKLVERYATYTAYGLFAQSIGGGGGHGGTSVAVGSGFAGRVGTWNLNLAVAVGGEGGDGNTAGAVSITNKAAVSTQQEDSHALFAQSVGGGGGNGGNSFTATIELGASNQGRGLNGDLRIGGKGGTGNLAGTVHVENHARVESFGDGADGIRAQSIGGGGGSGGSARGISILLRSQVPFSGGDVAGAKWKTALTIGGDGGSGNDGNTVTVDNHGEIVTHGEVSHGIFAQSIGGGGGAGGDGINGVATGAASYLSLGLFPFMDSGGKGLTGMLLGQLRDLSLTVGGSGGAQGHAQAATVTNHGSITTTGFASSAIRVQSVGGGGGDVSPFASGRDAAGKTVAGALGKFAIGGSGGAAGNGGAVRVDNFGALDTSGQAAYGLYAQSVGGGGGNAGQIQRAGASSFNIGLGLDFCGFGLCDGGNAGNGGRVDVTGSGRITTRGDDAYGIFAQSVGGGGGTASSLGLIAAETLGRLGLVGSTGGHGSGGVVSVVYDGDIGTSGADAHGIFAQSAGGRQGTSGGFTYDGTGGNVTVTYGGTLAAGGDDADGILAQSTGVAARGDVIVELTKGSVQGGRGSGAGVRILDGRQNRLVNRGTIGALSGLAVVGGSGDEAVENFGRIVGDVDLGGGRNSFVNRGGGTLDSRANVTLGAGNRLTNEGLLSPGGRGSVQTTRVDGSFTQAAGGVYVVDLDVQRGLADRVDVSGAAEFGGSVQLVVRQPAPASRRVTLLAAGGALQAQLPSLDAARSAVARYRLVTEGSQVVLDYRIDFSDVDGLNANQRRLGGHVNDIQRAGGTSAFAPIADGLFAIPEVPGLAAAYDRMSPEPYVALGIAAQIAQLQFNDAVMSCRVADGEAQFAREGECGWISAGRSWLRQQQTAEVMGFRREAHGVSGGLQRELTPGLHVGVGLAGDDSTTTSGGFASGRGGQMRAAAMLKLRLGQGTLAAVASGSSGHYDSERAVDLPSGHAVARSEARIAQAAFQLRAAHTFERGDWYLRPSFDVGVTQLRRSGFAETGAGAANLTVAGERHALWSVKPAVELGGEWRQAGGPVVRPFVRVGLQRIVSGDAPRAEASFEGAPDGTAPFFVQGRLDRRLWELSTAVDVFNAGRTVLRVGYSGLFGRHLESHAATVKLALAF